MLAAAGALRPGYVCMALHTQACQGLCVLNVCESIQLGLLVEIRSQLEKALCAGLSGCSIAARLRYPVFR